MVKDQRLREVALGEICRIYWPPLYAFARRQGADPENAKDMVQGFLAKLLERGTFESLSPEKGRLRTFLMTALQHYLINQWERDRAQRRGGGKVILSLDIDDAERFCAAELARDLSPAIAYDRNWGRTLMAQAIDRLREEHRIMQKSALFEALFPCLDGVAPGEHEALGARLGMKANTIAVTIYRMKERLRELIRAEARETVGCAEDADAELKEVLNLLAQL